MSEEPGRRTRAGAEVDPHLRNFTILVADDSRTMRKIFTMELEALGFSNILQAHDGQQAMDTVRTKAIDLLLLDMEMPEMDGLEVLAAIKGDEQLKSLPVIVISGAEEVAKAIRCIETGAEDYLPKPFDPVLLRARIVSSLEKKRLRDLEIRNMAMLAHEKQLVELEQMKTERLMLNILPAPIADRLKRGEKTISGSYDNVSILFSDLVGFTQMSSAISASMLVKLLNDLFTRFDQRAQALGLEKIKTIGDAYMAAAGLPIPRSDHAALCADMALGMLDDLTAFNRENGQSLNMRIGINSGPVVAGVIGHTKFTYDLWGNTVNTASRIESTSRAGRAQVSAFTYELIKDQFEFEDGQMVNCKGLGDIMTYLLLRRR
jgi:class 3 adenylate cyclase